MLSIGGNNDLEITTGKQPLGSFKHNKFLKATYQTNTAAGKLNPNYKIEIIK